MRLRPWAWVSGMPASGPLRSVSVLLGWALTWLMLGYRCSGLAGCASATPSSNRRYVTVSCCHTWVAFQRGDKPLYEQVFVMGQEDVVRDLQDSSVLPASSRPWNAWLVRAVTASVLPFPGSLALLGMAPRSNSRVTRKLA